MNGYTYEFNPLGDSYAEVERTNHLQGKTTAFRTKLSDDQILCSAGRQVTSIVADLMDIGGAVLIADRLSPRREYQCTINIKLPVRNPQIFNSENVQRTLQSALHHFTHDLWVLNFIPHYGRRRIAERQQRFFARTENESNVDVALFSGGLDALGGLAHQLVDKPETFFSLVSIGTNNPRIHNVQTTLAHELLSGYSGSRIQHILIDTPRHYQDSINTNDDFRARAFAFLLIGSAFALLEEQNKLYVYENGIGAINLPFRASEVGLDHSRTVHPLSLKHVGDFVSNVIDQNFRIENPFLFYTKAEICTGIKRANLTPLILQSVTCDRIGRNNLQCGTCSSCLLRRQAIRYLELNDTPYAMNKKNTYLRHMIYQVESLQNILDSMNPWELLAKAYPTVVMDLDITRNDLGFNLEELHTHILNLYERYLNEWQRIKHHFEDEMTFGITNSVA
jgi:hypothetical protein